MSECYVGRNIIMICPLLILRAVCSVLQWKATPCLGKSESVRHERKASVLEKPFNGVHMEMWG